MPPYLVEARKHKIYFLKQEMGGVVMAQDDQNW